MSAQALACVIFTTLYVSRGSADVPATRLSYTDEVGADGVVISHVKGDTEDGYVSYSTRRDLGHALDLATVKAARLSQGWRVVAEVAT